jgi:signal peptidase I
MRSSFVQRAVLVLAAFFLVATWWMGAPPALGGTTSYVVTSGTSMLPRFHTGDLAVVRSEPTYSVGEIVAYRSTVLDAVVLHRIVAIDDGRYTFKGDNNAWVDPDPATKSQLLGALWLQIPHGGLWLRKLQTPLGVGLLGATAAGLAAIGFTGRKRRRRRPLRANERSVQMATPHRSPAGSSSAVRTVLASAMGVCLLAALLGLTHHSTTTENVAHPYGASTTFAYRGSAPRGAVYPEGVVVTGQPVFVRLAPVVIFRATRVVHGVDAGSESGTSSMTATISAANGWSRTLVIAPPEPIKGAGVTRSGTVDLATMIALANQVATLTGSSAGTYQLSIALHVTGSVGSGTRVLPDVDSPTVAFDLSETELIPAATTSSIGGVGLAAIGTNYSFSEPVQEPASVSIAGHSLSVRWLRSLGMAGVLLTGLSLLLLALAYRPRSEADRIRRRHGASLVPVSRLPGDGSDDVVDVVDFEALARLAQRYERVILLRSGRVSDDYFVRDDSVTYRYRVPVSGGDTVSTQVVLAPALRPTPLA